MHTQSYQAFPVVLLYFVFIWSLIWKGIALWKAAKENRRNWFIAMLVLNTIGILEIIFLFFYTKEKLTMKKVYKALLFWKK
jgi:hypothetical protein